MEIEKDEIKPFKPLPKNSKFLKPNKNGQVAKDCIHFNFCGKHCWIDGDYEKNATDCKILKGEYCNEYKKGETARLIHSYHIGKIDVKKYNYKKGN